MDDCRRVDVLDPNLYFASCAVVSWALSIGLIDLPFSHWTHVAFEHPSRVGRLVLNLIVTSVRTQSLLCIQKAAGMVGWLFKTIHVAYREVAKLTSVDIKLDLTTRAASSRQLP